MKRRRLYILLMALIASIQLLSAQTLSIDDCIGMALRGNKSVQSAEWRVNQYENTRKALKANYFPKISAQVTDLWSTLGSNMNINIADPISGYITNRAYEFAPILYNSEITGWYFSTLPDRLSRLNPVVDFKVGNVFSALAIVEQPVYMGGKISAAYKMGQLGEEMARLGMNVSEEEVILKTYEAYSLMMKAKEMKIVAGKYDSLLVQIENTVTSAQKHGMARQADLMKVKATRSQAALQVHQAENGLKLAMMNLCQTIGLPILSKIDIEPMAPLTGTEMNDLDGGVSSRSEYRILDMKAKLAGEKVKLERSDFLPQIGIMLAGGYLYGGEMFQQDIFNNMYASVALNVKIPIFHAGEGWHKVQAAKAEYEQARLEQENLNEMMVLEIQQARNAYDEAVLDAALKEDLLEEATENLRMSRKAYENGMETISDLLAAQTEWQNIYAGLVEARHTLAIREIGWRKAAGVLSR